MKKSLIAAVAILLTCTTISFAQDTQELDFIESFTGHNVYDFDFVGGGTRAKGMGNAFLGVSNDVTGGSWNPAGIFELDKTTMGISWFSMSPRGLTTSKSPSDTTGLFHSGKLDDISSLSFISPLRISGHPFVFSLNLSRTFNGFTQLEYRYLFDYENTTFAPLGVIYVDTNEVDFTQNVRQEGGLDVLNIGFGTRFHNNISFGATINIYSGKSILTIENNSIMENFRYGAVQFATVIENTIIEDTNKFSGTNFTLGFMYNGDKLNAGLTIKTPFKLEEDREQSRAVSASLNGLVAVTDTTFYNDILYQYEMPLMIGAGVGYNVNENWLLAADVEYRGFSGKNVNNRTLVIINPGGSNEEEFEIIDPKWNNSFSLRVGTEYMNSFNFANVPIRAGFGYVPVPGASVSDVGTSSTVVNYNISAGTGLHFDQIHLDIAYMFTTANYEIGMINSEFDFKNHNIIVSFTGVF